MCLRAPTRSAKPFADNWETKGPGPDLDGQVNWVVCPFRPSDLTPLGSFRNRRDIRSPGEATGNPDDLKGLRGVNLDLSHPLEPTLSNLASILPSRLDPDGRGAHTSGPPKPKGLFSAKSGHPKLTLNPGAGHS